MAHARDSIDDRPAVHGARRVRRAHADSPKTGGGAGSPEAGGSVVADIVAEFSEVFAFARTRWMRYAEEVDPELRGAGMIVLQHIMRKGPVTATGIGQLLDMDKAVVSRQIAKLRDLGLVEAEPAPDDRRVMLLMVSDRARGLLEDIKARWAHAYHERFEGWDEHDLESLRAALHRFNASADRLRADSPAVRCARAAEAETAAEA